VPSTDGAPLVSIVIPAFDKWAYTFKCLMAIAQATRDVRHEIIVVDNASSDETAQALPLLDQVRVLRNPENLGFARACNQGAAMARGRYLLFLNNDTEPRDGWLSAMVRAIESAPDVEVVGNKLLFPDGTIQHAGVAFAYGVPFPLTPFHVHYRAPADAGGDALVTVQAVTAACMLVRPARFAAVGGFDEGYVNGYEDVDLCLKIGDAGGRIVYAPDSVVVHHESVSEGRFAHDGANIDRLNRRWLARFDGKSDGDGAGFRFEADVRRELRPASIDAARPPTSVIIPLRDPLWTLAPCLENVLRTLGPDDQLVLVDDGSTGATGELVRLFAARHADRVTRLRHDDAIGLPRAALRGLEAAARPRAVVMAPSLRVVGDWLARLSAHLAADPRIGALTPALLPVERLRLRELLYPAAAPAADPPLPRAAPGDVEAVRWPAAPLVYGDRPRLLALSRRAPEIFFGGAEVSLGAELEAQGTRLACARDVGVYRLSQIPGDCAPSTSARYVAQQGANLGYERRWRDSGRAPRGRITAAQTELASLVVVVAAGEITRAAACLDAVYRHTHRSLEVILVDNRGDGDGDGRAGDDRALPALAATLRARHGNLIYLRNLADPNPAQAFNQGLAAARGDYLVALHDDTLVTPGWLSRLLALMAIDPAVALVGPALSSCGGGAQSAGMRTYRRTAELPLFGEQWSVSHHAELALFSPLSGACLVMRRQVAEAIGGFDPGFAGGIYADYDFCVRAARRGHRMAIAFDVFVHHQGGATFGRLGLDRRAIAEIAWRRFCAKWNHPPGARSQAEIRALSAASFDPDRDRIPLPGAPHRPLATDRRAGSRT
jgi:GT2 family glycosyltransferase